MGDSSKQDSAARTGARRKQAEQKIPRSERLLQALAEQTPQAVFVKDLAGRYLLFNPAAVSLTGKSTEEVLGRDDTALFPPAEARRVMETDRQIIASGEDITVEEVLPDTTGDLRTYITTKGPLRDEDGKITGIFGLARDITDLKKAEAALRDSEERFRSTFEQAAVGMAHAGPSGQFLRVNDRLCEITGYSREELLQKTFSDITCPEDIELGRELERKLMAKELSHYTREKRYVRKDGTLVWVNLIVSQVRDVAGNPQYSLGVMEDISARKALEAKLREAKEEAEAATRAKSQFLAKMSHELRTPVTAIMGSLELLKRPGTAPERDQLVEMADTSAYRLLGIIDDLLDIAKIEAGQLKIEEQPFDLRDCVRRAVEMFASPAREKGLRLHWSVDPQLPEQVNGDPARLGQVLINLVGNAIKFTRSGEVSVRVAGDDGQIVFSVSDTGIGIPPDHIDQLFQPFMQVDSSLSRTYGGTGLGLAISKELVEMMGGAIGVETEVGQGSTFTFTISLRPVETPAEQLPPESMASCTLPLEILLVEDDPMVRNLTRTILKNRGLSVAIAENGREAVARWQAGGIDVVLMDLQMPEVNGLEATRQIRELEEGQGRRSCIFALTAHARPEDRQECLAAGMDGFLAKPLRIEELNKLIENCPCGLQSKSFKGVPHLN